MKKIILDLIAILPVILFAQQPSHRFKSEGALKGVVEETIYLAYPHAGGKFGTDSVQLKNGHFHFEGATSADTY